jgi:hypothetical protein
LAHAVSNKVEQAYSGDLLLTGSLVVFAVAMFVLVIGAVCDCVLAARPPASSDDEGTDGDDASGVRARAVTSVPALTGSMAEGVGRGI